VKAVAVVAVFAGLGVVALGLWFAVDGTDRVLQRHALRARDVSGARAWILGTSITALWSGIVLVAAWSMVKYPGAHDLDVPEQPAPALLWQVGAAMAVGGAVVTFLAWHTASAGGHAAHEEPRPGLVLAALVVATDVPAVVAATAAPHSELVWAPLVLAGIVTAFSLYVWAADPFDLRS